MIKSGTEGGAVQGNSMEPELVARVKNLPYKVRASSKESQAQKAVHVLDPDLRSHWSTSTNSKEWLLLELEESCLLSHIRVHNKSVLEWEFSIGLRFKPDTFLKVRPRCEAPRREITYHVGYLPCRFVRISCLRGNPIAIFHIQLLGITVPGLEPEFQPVVDHLLPHITAHMRDPQDIYLQLLQDIAFKLSPFLPQLEGELSVANDAVDISVRFLAMLVGPFHPILAVIGRENEKVLGAADVEASKNNQASVFTVSSNFQVFLSSENVSGLVVCLEGLCLGVWSGTILVGLEKCEKAPPKRLRSPGQLQQPAGHTLALRPDVALLLLRAASKDGYLSTVCQKVAKLLCRLGGLGSALDVGLCGDPASGPSGLSLQVFSGEDTSPGTDSAPSTSPPPDYSIIFGEDLKLIDDELTEITYLDLLDMNAVEEGLFHLLYACASQVAITRRLADSKSNLSAVLPFIQATLPALRPPSSTTSTTEQVDESFSQWQSSLVQRALSQVVALSSSPSYQQLLDACAGYLLSYSPAHEKAACVLIDLCTGPLAPWLPMVIAKVDLAIEFLEDLLGVIQSGQNSTGARAAILYLMLGLSGHMDDMLVEYKDVKHQLLFLIEMLEPYLIPAITPVKNTIAFGDVSSVILDKQEQNCALAIDLLQTAIRKPGILSAMEGEWRRGHAVPSVLLSILAPHVPLPPGIDLRKSALEKGHVIDTKLGKSNGHATSVESNALPSKPGTADDEKQEGQIDGLFRDTSEDGTNLFAPSELKGLSLPALAGHCDVATKEGHSSGLVTKPTEEKYLIEYDGMRPEGVDADEFFNLQAEYLQLVNTPERELRASEFVRFAAELHSRASDSSDSHQAATDALLLAAECHLNPFFMPASGDHQHNVVKDAAQYPFMDIISSKPSASSIRPISELVLWLEEQRDKAVLQIILQAAEWDNSLRLGSPSENFENPDANEGVEPPEVSGVISIADEDGHREDAVTVIRQHQALVCKFLVRQLQRDRHNMYEVLLHGLLFVLESATELAAPATDIVGVILQAAERLNASLTLYHNQLHDGTAPQVSAKFHSIRRQWALLRRLVIVSSGGRSGDQHGNTIGISTCMELVPAWAWVAKIPQFSASFFPLVRFVGWMALSRLSKFSKETGLRLVTDVTELSRLMLIFSDELVLIGGFQSGKGGEDNGHIEQVTKGYEECAESVSQEVGQIDRSGLVKVLYPELDEVFPNLKLQFRSFAQTIMDSVCLQLKEVPRAAVPDMLTWFLGLCQDPFCLPDERPNQAQWANGNLDIKGSAASNARSVILRLLEVIVLEHIDAILPELPRVMRVVLALCSSSYCDARLFESVMMALKPIISHSTASAAAVELHVAPNGPSVTFESLCFDMILEQLKSGPNHRQQGFETEPRKALLLFLSGFILSDLSQVKRNDLLSSLVSWTDLKAHGAKETLHVYLSAFLKILEECAFLLAAGGDAKTLLPISRSLEAGRSKPSPDVVDRSKANTPSSTSSLGITGTEYEDLSKVDYLDAQPQRPQSDETESCAGFQLVEREGATLFTDNNNVEQDKMPRTRCPRASSEATEFREKVQKLVISLSPSLETAWRLHPQLTAKVSRSAASCLFYSSVLPNSDTKKATRQEEGQEDALSGVQKQPLAVDPEAFVQNVILLQQLHCWQGAGAAIDYFLSTSVSQYVADGFPLFCQVLLHRCSHAPRIAWRLQTSGWLSKALMLAQSMDCEASVAPLVHLLCTMLGHPEPEQRAGALQQLGKFVDNEISGDRSWNGVVLIENSRHSEKGLKSDVTHVLVASTWSKVSYAAAWDPLLGLRRQALELLLKFIPLAQSPQLLSFLSAVDKILPHFSQSGRVMSSSSLGRLALSVFGKACLYSSPSDLDAIPDKVWISIKAMSEANPGSVFMESERAVCQALLRLRDEGESAKQHIGQALSSPPESEGTRSQHVHVREAVLEVLARLNKVRLTVDASTSAAMRESMDLEQAEIELELAKEEQILEDAGMLRNHRPSTSPASTSGSSGTVGRNLVEVRSQISSIERSMARAEISARRERLKLLRHEQQLALEESRIRELQLIQMLERERAAEAEREVERQRALEKEKAKTRELKYALEMEVERRNQREYQRDLEQRESSATRASRREYPSSTPSSRPRERYRERDREGGRQEGSSRPSNGSGSGTTPPATPTAGGSSSNQTHSLSIPSTTMTLATAPATAVTSPVALSSRAYPGQSLALLHARERSEDRGYDEVLDGNGMLRDDVSSYGESEAGVGMDSNLSSSQRQSSRSSRPRQVVERRERDGRREGKWERKQNKLDGCTEADPDKSRSVSKFVTYSQ